MSTPTKRTLLATSIALAGMLGIVISVYGVGEPGAEALVRWTARSSLVFFAAAFVAPSLAAASWLALNRYGFVLSLVMSHGLHALAIGALAVLTEGENLVARGAVVIAAGALGYAAIGVAALRPESQLAQWGSHWVWFVFFAAYLPRALHSPLLFGPAIALLALVLWLRIRDSLRRRQQHV